MTPEPVVIIYTQDADVARRVKAYASALAQVRHVQEADRLEPVAQQSTPAIVLADLRARAARDLLDQLQREFPDVLLIALGTPRSEPLRDAENSGLYAAEDLQMERRPFQAMIARAIDHSKVLQHNRELREASSSFLGAVAASSTAFERASSPFLRFPRIFRRFDSGETLLKHLVESLADTAGVTRVGIFSRARSGGGYRLRAGLRCLPETAELQYEERDPLLRWFETHVHLIARANLPQLTEPGQRALLRRALDTFGAEVLVPLFARNEMMGWVFFGHHNTGRPFDQSDLEGLTLLAEHVSTVLENEQLYQEITRQKTLAETLLTSIPPGIVAIDENAIIRWFNPPAESILGQRAQETLDRPAEAAGGKLALMLRQTLDATADLRAQKWVDPKTHRSISVETRRFADQRGPLGAVAVIQDLTAEENFRQKQDLVDRAAFWTDLAASMSHEIRNPLVAIKTFAQLLPERFDDADFRKSFSDVVVQEVDRLDKIITQINTFAHPIELKMKPLDLRAPVERGLQLAREKFSVNGGVAIETQLPADLPKILGDESALAEAFAHLVANAAEAVTDQKKPRITLSAKPIHDNGHGDSVLVTVHDNGRGIAPEMREKIFSPFCTTKARGMGLGLPIVKRTIYDHNGRLDIDTNPSGTSVNIALPVSSRVVP